MGTKDPCSLTPYRRLLYLARRKGPKLPLVDGRRKSRSHRWTETRLLLPTDSLATRPELHDRPLRSAPHRPQNPRANNRSCSKSSSCANSSAISSAEHRKLSLVTPARGYAKRRARKCRARKAEGCARERMRTRGGVGERNMLNNEHNYYKARSKNTKEHDIQPS